MHRLIVLVFLLLSAPLAADTEAEIKAALDYFAEVWNEGDLDAVTSYYHSDFVLLTETGPVSRAQHLDGLTELSEDGGDRGKLAYSQVTVRELGEKHALAYGTVTLEFKDSSAIQTWFSTVYLETPFGWKAVLTRN